MNLNESYQKIEDLLQIETGSSEPLQTRQGRRDEIGKEIRDLTSQITTLSRRFRALPDLPPISIVQWAQAVLEFPNLAFLVLDTTGVEDDSDIIRVYVADREGKTLLDQLVLPDRQITANTSYTGISEEKLLLASRLPEVWHRVQEVLKGRYVLAYNLTFVTDHLDENAEHYGLPEITLIGECLQNKVRDYWNTYYPSKLTVVCQRIGHQLPQPPTAPERVAGQLALLKAMSQGITDAVEKEDFLPEVF